MANTTNLSLQKIEDTDYAGNFPTIYNDNLDLLDTAIASKQDILTAGQGISISSNTISARITWGTTAPDDTTGEVGDVFILIGE